MVGQQFCNEDEEKAAAILANFCTDCNQNKINKNKSRILKIAKKRCKNLRKRLINKACKCDPKFDKKPDIKTCKDSLKGKPLSHALSFIQNIKDSGRYNTKKKICN